MAAKCISYENLIGALKELSAKGDFGTTHQGYVRQTLEFLQNRPETANLVKEALSNTSCDDLARLVIALTEGQVKPPLQVPSYRRETTESIGMPVPPPQVPSFSRYDFGMAPALLTAVLMGAGLMYFYRLVSKKSP